MCGIVGAYSKRNRIQEADITRMRDAIAYRGPDEAGNYVRGPIGLGHRRLSIIDLASGFQPLSTPDGRYTIIFNGEIYNYRQLRQNLEKFYTFRTNSDTEVLLYHVIHYGQAGLSQLNGMFAFALWDNERNSLFLARDRFGKKPLYYQQRNDEFLFASELKSILAYQRTKPTLDKRALARYLLFEYIPDPDTPFENIKKLPAGSYMTVSESGAHSGVWWRLYPFPRDYAGTFEKPVATLDALLAESVSKRMVADVPVGVLLSGGLDSTTIAWYMRQHTKQLHSFSISFNDDTFDESRYAKLASQSLNTEHHNVSFSLDSFFEALNAIQTNMDEPLADVSLLPTYFISQEAKKYVTVVLDGDGADELFFGYDTFPAYQVSLLYERIPFSLRGAIEKSVAAMPTRYSYFSLDFKLKSFLRGSAVAPSIRNQVWIGSFQDNELKAMLAPGYQISSEDLYRPVEETMQRWKKESPLTQLSLIYLTQYLQGDILQKVDRATMYASLEARTPFLDPTLVSFALQLPEHQKYRVFRGKQILRTLMERRIPPEIIHRKKQGFGIPLGNWLRGPLQGLLQNTLSESNIRNVGIVHPAAVEQIINQHVTGKADNRKQLWTLMVLHWWHQRWA